MISFADGVERGWVILRQLYAGYVGEGGNGYKKGPRKGLCCSMWRRTIRQQPEG